MIIKLNIVCIYEKYANKEFCGCNTFNFIRTTLSKKNYDKTGETGANVKNLHVCYAT